MKTHTLIFFVLLFIVLGHGSAYAQKEPSCVEGKIWGAIDSDPRDIKISFYADNRVTLVYSEGEDQMFYVWRGEYEEKDKVIKIKFETVASSSDHLEAIGRKPTKYRFSMTGVCRGLKKVTSSEKYDLASYDYMTFKQN